MTFFSHLFNDIHNIFSSPKAHAVEKEIADLLPAALQIVQMINSFAPNRSLSEINYIAERYALPAITSLETSGQTPGNVLLNLATQILKDKHAPSASVAILNTAVQLAVVADKVKAPSE